MVAIVGTVLIREVSLTPLYMQEARTGVCACQCGSVWVSLGQFGSLCVRTQVQLVGVIVSYPSASV